MPGSKRLLKRLSQGACRSTSIYTLRYMRDSNENIQIGIFAVWKTGKVTRLLKAAQLNEGES